MTSRIVDIFVYSLCCALVLLTAFPTTTAIACGTIAGFFLAILNDIYQLLRVEFGKRT